METSVNNKYKAFTSLEQSRKLSEILPLESADMSWVSIGLGKPFARTIPIKGDPEELCGCWSLAALLGVIPQEIFDGEYIINITEGCVNKWVLTYDHYENRNRSYYGLSSGADYLIDACVAMIEKLHELKLL